MRICLILLAVFLSSLTYAKDNDVLIIHSYHQGFFWTDGFQEGLEQVLDGSSVSTRVMYLDAKRNQSDEYLTQLYELYKTKFEQEQFQAVVVSDNIALNLVNRLGSQLKDTPVIFAGINNYRKSLHSNLSATGLIEHVDLYSNIALIERLQPALDKIYIVSDHSETGRSVREQISKFLRTYPEYERKIVQVIPNTYQELIDSISQLGPQSAALFWVYYRDINGRVIAERQLWKELNQFSNAPIYMVHDLGLDNGAVGGVLIGGKQHGVQAGEILLDVLENNQWPKVSVARPEIKLDYQVVQKWGLGAEDVTSSVYFNRPQSLVEQYHREIKLVGSLVSVLLFIIVILVYYLSRLKRSEQLATESQMLTEMVFDQSYHFIGVLDSKGCVTSSNRKLQELLYNQGFNQDSPIWQHKYWQQGAVKQFKRFLAQEHQGNATQFEAEVWHAEEGALVLEISLKPIPSGVESARYLLEAKDITSRKITEERLYQREANLSHYYDQQPVMMVTLDDQNRIQQVNHFAEQLLGYTPDQILGHRLSEFYLHEDALIPRQVLLQPKQVMKGVWRREVEYCHADGQVMWVRENIRPLVETGHLLIVGEDITETRKLSEQLAYQARHDVLTGTYSRNYFEKELDKALQEVETHIRTHAMLYLDLDQLKVLNDTAGHEAGDAAIQFCASMLEEVLPYNTVLARMGGDEFAIILKDCTEYDAKKLAKMIIHCLSEHPFVWEDIRLNLNCSIGIRLIDHTASSPQMVHAQADTACHVAKEEGRNRYSLYCQDDKELRRREQEMESVNLVHDALANKRIELFGQRIMSLGSDESGMHFEILVRIRNVKGDYISPGIFMPASERYNIAHLIDREVVSQTLDWFGSNPLAMDNLSQVAINLSGHSMGNREFIQFLLTRLQESPIPCDKICLEITETAAMSNMNQAIEFFSQLKALGCLIALDDFGSGLSSFGYLKKLPVDIVKIDGIFVRDIDVNEMDHLMVRSINDLAKQMGKRTVAEFVENTCIIDRLMDLGVDYAQGYIIGKPKPLPMLVDELIDEHRVSTKS